jgi:CRP-like cAMP-binding protein
VVAAMTAARGPEAGTWSPGTPDNGSGSFLGGLSAGLIMELRARSTRRIFRRGSVVCAQGEQSLWLVVVLSGHVKVSTFSGDGSEVVLDIRGPGSLIGELEAIDGQPRPATVTALNSVEALVVAREVFAEFIHANGQALGLLLQLLCERLREAERRRVEFTTMSAAQRVITRLLELADRHGQRTDNGISIAMALTQVELASWAGVSREAASKALGALRRRRLVETGRRTVLIRDLSALQQRIF